MTAFDTDSLRQRTTADVLEPSDEGYDEARSVFNARFDPRPAVIVRCREPDDVVAAVAFARRAGLAPAVKSGGHSYAANTVSDGDLLIDLSAMKEIQVDLQARTVQVGAGVTWGELDQETQKHGLAASGVTVSSVGVAGSTLGGGNGYLTRKHGMLADNLLSAEVVTSDARRARANADENPDLFWALRGGGGNFGIATSFEIRLHELGPEVLAGQIVHRFDDAEGVLRLYRQFVADAPDEIQCYAFVLRVPPIPEFPEEHHGRIAIDLVVFHTDPGATEAFRPLLDFGDPILAFVAPQPYVEVQRAFDAGLPAGQRYESRSHDFDRLSDDAISAFLAGVGELPGELTMAYFGPGGGAMGRVDPTATAFPHRGVAHSLHVLAGWTDPARDGEITAWARGLHDSMTPFATGGVYVNLLGTDEQSRVRAAYGVNYDRLAEIKAKWDPDNLFRGNHNVVPSD